MKGNRKPMRPSWARILYAAAFPFLLALVVSLSLLRRGEVVTAPDPVRQRQQRGVLESQAECPGPGCGGQAALAAGGPAADTALVPGGNSSDGGAAAATPGQQAAQEPLFLFIGILSGRGYRHRRLAVREAWANRAQIPGVVVSKFILSEDERTPQVQKELEMYNDIVFVKEKTNYKSILYKTFYVLEYGVKHYDVKFVLKTDDDAFINVEPLIQQLKTLCETADCSRERMYLGKMAKHSEVLLQPGHKWNNAVFHNHTGLKVYPNYMMGGGYVMSGEVCRVLVDVHARMPLKFTPIEDATLGFWLMSMDLRHVDHPRFYTWAAPCCFKAPVRKQGQRIVTRFQLAEEFEEDLCSPDPWLVLHKIDSPTKMRYVGAKVANCSYAQFSDSLPSSIEAYVPTEKVEDWRRRHPNASPYISYSERMKRQREEAAAAAAAAEKEKEKAAAAADPTASAASTAEGGTGTAAAGGASAAATQQQQQPQQQQQQAAAAVAAGQIAQAAGGAAVGAGAAAATQPGGLPGAAQQQQAAAGTAQEGTGQAAAAAAAQLPAAGLPATGAAAAAATS